MLPQGCCDHAQAALAYWSVVSPFSPYGPTIALVVILLVAAIKALIEDAGRHREDVKINNGKARILQNNGTQPFVPCNKPCPCWFFSGPGCSWCLLPVHAEAAKLLAYPHIAISILPPSQAIAL